MRSRIIAFTKTQTFRVLLHIGFWLFYLSLPIWQYLKYSGYSVTWIKLVTVMNLTFVLFYYPFAYYIVPKYFVRRKAYLFLIYTVLIYATFFYLTLWMEKFSLSHFIFNEQDKIFLENAIKRNVYYVPELLQIIIVTAIPLSLKFMRRYYQLQDEKNVLSKINTQLELDFLKSQINPHFLFNSLNNIYSLTLQKSDKAPEMVIKLSDLMRYMLYECNVEKNEIEKEIAFMENYIELEKIRHGEQVKIELIKDIRNTSIKIPPLLLIPFIENAFKHGLNSQFGYSWVRMVISTTDKTLAFECENNTLTNNQQIQNTAGGIGIENTKKRLQLIYPERHSLEIEQKNDIFKVTLNIKF